MQILAIILGIVTTLLALFSLCSVIKNYFRRKTKTINVFEVYKENELAYVAMSIFNIAFAVLLIVGGVMSKADDTVPGSMIIFIFIACVSLSYFIMRLTKRSLAVRNETISAFSKLFFPAKTFNFTDISRAHITNNYLFLYNTQNICIAKAQTVCANYGVFLQLLINNKINIIYKQLNTYSGNPPQNIVIKMPVLLKIFSLTATFAATIGFGFLAFANFADITAKIVLLCFEVMFLLIFVLLFFTAFRWKIVIENNIIIYTPFFGKERKYSCQNIDCINKSYTEMRGVKYH